MSLQMRVVHFCMGLVPPLLHSETATEQMALHAPKPHPMPRRMRARATASHTSQGLELMESRGRTAQMPRMMWTMVDVGCSRDESAGGVMMMEACVIDEVSYHHQQ